MSKKNIGYLIGILLIGTLIVLMVKPNLDGTEQPEKTVEAPKNERVGLEKGDTPPDFELTTLEGEVVNLSDYKGEKVILNFWASWCGPCKAEMPHMQAYYENNKDSENVEILAVNMTTQERRGMEGIKNFVDSHALTFPIPLDEEGLAIDMYKVMTIPTTYMIGTDHKIAQKIVGPMDEEMLEDLVRNLE